MMSAANPRSRSLILSMVIIVVTTSLASKAWAGPPFITDDPEPVEHGHWEVNYGLSKTWRQGSSSTALPSVDINYGLLPNVQLHAQPRYSRESSPEGHQSGIDDTEVGVKYRFAEFHHGSTTTSAGIYPMLQLRTGDKKLGDDRRKLQTLLPLWLQMDQDKWVTYGGIGYWINQGLNNRNSIFTGIAALYQVTEPLRPGGELFHETAAVIGQHSTSAFNLGGIYKLDVSHSLLFSAGKGIRNAATTNQMSVYVALQVLR